MARLNDLSWPVRCDRVTIRPAAPDDAEATWRFRRLDSVGQWLSASADDLEAYRATFTEPDRLATTLVIELDDTVIGDLMLRVEDAWAQKEVAEQAKGVQAELGWTLDPDHGGHGYVTEAVRELIRICFDELGLRRVTASCFSANEKSWRLMERLGMRRETHTVRESLHRSGEWLDGLSYALLADEWRLRAVAVSSGSPLDAPPPAGE